MKNKNIKRIDLLGATNTTGEPVTPAPAAPADATNDAAAQETVQETAQASNTELNTDTAPESSPEETGTMCALPDKYL